MREVTERTLALSLGGNLAEFPMGDVLTFLNMGQKTGAIEVLSGSLANRIFLSDGEVVYATSKTSRLKLPSLLSARGLLTDREARQLESRAAAEGRPFRDLVIEGGLIPAEEVANYEKVLYCELVFESMQWREGKFAFLAEFPPDDTVTPLRIGVQNLILEWARREDETSRSRREMEELNVDRAMVVTLVCATGRLEQQVVLTPVEWGTISLINGKRSLDEIFSLSPAGSEGETWMVIRRLEAAHLIQIHPPVETSATVLKASPIPAPSETRLTSAIPLADPSTVPPEPPPAEKPTVVLQKSDVRLISGDEVTTSHGMFGRRLPARLVAQGIAGESPAVFELDRPIMTIGRSDSNDVVLPDRSVSKHHAQLVQDGDGWRLIDLKSTNGTRVNGSPAEEQRLFPGDEIQFGKYTFTYDAIVLGSRG